jgi:nucleotide-binding universal stress UspA family protein
MELQAILVATDFSECAAAAFHLAQNLAKTYRAKLILVHVINQRLVDQMTSHLRMAAENLLPELRQRAQDDMDQFLKRVQSANLEVESIVAVGLPFQEIAVLARELAVDLVVLGGYGRSGRGNIEEVFFGSTAEKVVRLLPCPVLCVPLAEGSEQ